MTAAPTLSGFRHEALLYSGLDDFLARTTPFVRDGLEHDEPVLVVVDADKVAALRDTLGTDAGRVQFADMHELGANPARIIPAWRDFVDEQGGDERPMRGIGEPVWAGRTPAELAECAVHEALLNVAFADSPPWRLLCPYDTATLSPPAIEVARRTHPLVSRDGVTRPGSGDDPAMAGPLCAPLPEPGGVRLEMAFDAASLGLVRAAVVEIAQESGLGARASDLSLAVHEVAANSVRYGGGTGTLAVWNDDDALICEVRDAGGIADPLVGRERPSTDAQSGRGLWIANQLCDLVQLRRLPAAQVVRLHVRGSLRPSRPDAP